MKFGNKFNQFKTNKLKQKNKNTIVNNKDCIIFANKFFEIKNTKITCLKINNNNEQTSCYKEKNRVTRLRYISCK